MSAGAPAPGTPEYNKESAEWWQDRRPGGEAGMILTLVVVTGVLATRLWQTRKRNGRWDASDYLITLAWAIGLYMVITSILALKYGIGLHLLRVVESYPQLDMVEAFKFGYPISIMQAPAFLCIKLALLHYYRRIFYVHQRWLNIWLWFNAVYAVLWSIGTFLYFTLQCLPVAGSWQRYQIYYHKPWPAGVSCVAIDPNPHIANWSVIIGILGLLSDVAILVTPLMLLPRLELALRKKIGVIIVFGFGFLAVGISIARIVFFGAQSTVVDVTWEFYPSVVWLDVEILVAIGCTCVPPAASVFIDFGAQCWNAVSSAVVSLVGRRSSSLHHTATASARATRALPAARHGHDRPGDMEMDSEWILKGGVGASSVIAQASHSISGHGLGGEQV